MNINFVAVLVASVVEFIIGAIWYMPLFGSMWRKIHGIGKPTKTEQEKMMKTMGPYLGIQFLLTIVTTVILAILIKTLPMWNAFILAKILWFGFVVPTQVSAVLFGGTEGKWVFPKIAIMAGGSLLCLEAAAAILSFMR